jgi:hypothetical protein
MSGTALCTGEQGAAHVDREHVVERLERDGFEGFGQRADAGAGVDDVETAVALNGEIAVRLLLSKSTIKPTSARSWRRSAPQTASTP